MPKGYFILTEAIHDRAGMDAYAGTAGPSIRAFGGRVLVATEELDVVEGEWPGDRTIVVEFDSVEQARAWYGSESYQDSLPLRLAAASCNAVIVSGFAPRPS
jgi:uncharacterized protein (DUF1330 family)